MSDDDDVIYMVEFKRQYVVACVMLFSTEDIALHEAHGYMCVDRETWHRAADALHERRPFGEAHLSGACGRA